MSVVLVVEFNPILIFKYSCWWAWEDSILVYLGIIGHHRSPVSGGTKLNLVTSVVRNYRAWFNRTCWFCQALKICNVSSFLLVAPATSAALSGFGQSSCSTSSLWRRSTRSATLSSSPEEPFRDGGGLQAPWCSPTTTRSTLVRPTASVPSYRFGRLT